ncbi:MULTISPECIES: DUF5703 family protein [Saccharopolyspora]|uniref:DUF5703 family protein n=1 Tax=Saccharopolyspora TaxID=1835 RepID=UPI001CD7F3BB|nr:MULTISPECIES: DUF5703 family protein [Saccharopolyspora]MCA1190459.1 DUF5703 family protein [Saccharopolyspora sp. 6T]MCA1195279.1 DUF5703 family protein [Saccharopolyspora sp. 6V]MCA1228579.1 DUF5703 family protein [Saccharopolyspora sp. 6M]MCA1283390.1 DUF5703 family protein [Saccharopolyspora sp. 7B]
MSEERDPETSSEPAPAGRGARESGFSDEKWDYRPLRLPPGITRLSAATQLSIHAEFSGWELSRVLLYSDGTRKVWLRRRRSTPGVPELRT